MTAPATGDSFREKHRDWHERIKSGVFELDIEFDDAPVFDGMTSGRRLGSVQLTRIQSTAVKYHRAPRLCGGADPKFLVCMPLAGEVELNQLGRRTRCAPGRMLLEHSEEPYRFHHRSASDMWTFLLPESMLEARIRNPMRYCALDFDSHTGVGKLFGDFLQAVAGNDDLGTAPVQAMVGTQLADLLAAVLNDDPRILQSTESSVRNAHLARIEQYLRNNAYDSELSAETVAAACRISVRYLHLLFRDTGMTLMQWVREHRLQMAHEVLTQATGRISISQVAYRHGFKDHAQFSTCFKEKYGCTPSEAVKRGTARTLRT